MARRKSELEIVIDLDDNASGALESVNDSLGDLDEAAEDAGGSLDNMNSSLDSAGGSAESFGSIAGGIAGGALVALGAAVVAVGVKAVEMANEVESSSARMRTQMGLSAQEAGQFEETMRDIFRNNFGEDYEDIAQSLTAVNTQFERIGGLKNQAALQAVTENAIAIRDAFGVDVQESTSAIVTLMEQFGLTATQATDFVVAGFQQGLNASDDFLDSIGEYSVQFAEADATAGEFFSLLEIGLAGGVLGTDKAADAFKEFRNIVLDGSESTREAFDLLGLSYDEFVASVDSGEITIVEALALVSQEIADLDSQVDQNVVGVALFGGTWEDLGETGVLELGRIQDELAKTEGATETLAEQYKTAAGEMEGATRQWTDAMVDLGQAITEIGTLAIPSVVAVIDSVFLPALQGVISLLESIRDFGVGGGFLRSIKNVMGDRAVGGGGLGAILDFDPPPGSPLTGPPISQNISPVSGSGVPVNPQNLDFPINPVFGLPTPTPSLPSTLPASNVPPPGWVGPWNPNFGSGNNVVQNFYGNVGQSPSDLAELAATMGQTP